MAKTSTLHTNDPANPQTELVITGFVEKFVTLQPPGIIRLVGYADHEIKKTVSIIPEEKYPFDITKVTAQSGENIGFELSEKHPVTGAYELTVKNMKKNKGRYFDTLFIDTTSPIMPTFPIRVFGDVREKSNTQ